MRRLVLAATLLVSLAAAASASAATIAYLEETDPGNFRSGDTVTYTAAPKEANRVTVNCCLGPPTSPGFGALVLSDPGAEIFVSPDEQSQEHCAAAGSLAECSDATGFFGIQVFRAFLGPGADELRVQSSDFCCVGFATVDGGEGADRIYGSDEDDSLDVLTGGPQRDGLHGRGGDETILARDGGPDVVTCGGPDGGFDRVFADPVDSVATHCEDVFVG